MLWLKYFSLLFAHLPLWSRLRLGLSMMCWMFHKLYRKQSVSDIKNSVFCLTHLQTDFSVLNLVASTKPLPMEFQSFPSCYAWTDWIILFVLYLLFLGNSPQRLLTWRYKNKSWSSINPIIVLFNSYFSISMVVWLDRHLLPLSLGKLPVQLTYKFRIQ